MSHGGNTVTREQFDMNLLEKAHSREFREDITPLLNPISVTSPSMTHWTSFGTNSSRCSRNVRGMESVADPDAARSGTLPGR